MCYDDDDDNDDNDNYDEDLETYPDFHMSAAEKQVDKMLRVMKKEAKAERIIKHNIFDSEED